MACAWPTTSINRGRFIMTESLHIFVKDVRALRWHIVLLLAMTVVFGYYLWPWGFVLSLAQTYLMARVVHDDTLVGDRQFWITRPISWQALLAAKLLFLVIFVALPTFIADWAVLWREGLAPASHVPGLLWRTAANSALWIPVVAMAAVTRNLVEFIVASLLLSWL